MIAFDIATHSKESEQQPTLGSSQKVNGDLFAQLLSHAMKKQEASNDKQENVADMLKKSQLNPKPTSISPQEKREQEAFVSKLLQAQGKQEAPSKQETSSKEVPAPTVADKKIETKDSKEAKATPAHALMTQYLKDTPKDSLNRSHEAKPSEVLQKTKQEKIYAAALEEFGQTKKQLDKIAVALPSVNAKPDSTKSLKDVALELNKKPQSVQNTKDSKDSKDLKDSKDSKNIKVSKDTKDIKGLKDIKNIKVSKDLKDVKVSKDIKDSNKTQENLKPSTQLATTPKAEVAKEIMSYLNLKMELEEDVIELKKAIQILQKLNIPVSESKESINSPLLKVLEKIKTIDVESLKTIHSKEDFNNLQQSIKTLKEAKIQDLKEFVILKALEDMKDMELQQLSAIIDRVESKLQKMQAIHNKNIKEKLNIKHDTSLAELSARELQAIAKEQLAQSLLEETKNKILTQKEALILKNQAPSLPLSEAIVLPSKDMAVLQKIFSTSKMSLSLVQELVGKESNFTIKDLEKLVQLSELNLKKIHFSQEQTKNLPQDSSRDLKRDPKEDSKPHTVLSLSQDRRNASDVKNPTLSKQDVEGAKILQSILAAREGLSKPEQALPKEPVKQSVIEETLIRQNEWLKHAINQQKNQPKDEKPKNQADSKNKKGAKGSETEVLKAPQKTEHTSYKPSLSTQVAKEIEAKEFQAQAELGEYNKKLLDSKQEQQAQHSILSNMLKTPQKKVATAASMLDVLGAKVKQENKEKEPQAIVLAPMDSRREFIYKSVAAKETLRNFTHSLKEGIHNYKPPLSKLSLELAPENLGNVEVTIKQRGAQLVVQIHSNPQALQLFMANAQDFKQQLFGAGFENVEMTFQDSQGNSFSSTDGEGGGEYHGQQQKDQREESEAKEALTQAEEMLLRQELQQEETSKGKIWNSFGLRAYKNSMNISNKLRLIELTLKPRYA